MRSLITFLIITFFAGCLIGQDSDVSFGSIKLKIDSNEEKELNINTAILYESADVDFDTTVQVQNEDGSKVLYYPQIIEGSHKILRLILAPEDNGENFYDVIFNLGDSLKDRIIFSDAESRVFFNHRGKLSHFKNYTTNLEGRFLFLTEISKKEKVSGELNTTFRIPLDEELSQFSSISLEGAFDVYLGEFRAHSLATTPQLKKKESAYMKNLVIAMIIASIGFFVFLGQ